MNFIENESPTKLRGGYYTDARIANFLTRWILEIKPKRVLEPSCGDGVFITALAQLQPHFLEALLAFEIEPREAQATANKGTLLPNVKLEVHARDFLSWSLSQLWHSPEFDAVLGNPPFIRYQYLDDAQQLRAEKVFERSHLAFTKHTNAWVSFVIASLVHLKPSGRLAMVVPSEILHILHAESLRGFLTRECSRTLIIDPTELWFTDTLQGVVLLMAEKKALPTCTEASGVAIIAVRDRSFLDNSPGSYFERADFINGPALEGRKWMAALLTNSERALLADTASQKNVSLFSDIAQVDVGIVTGANKFFLIPDAVVEQYGLQRWAYPMFGRSEHVPGVIYDKATHEHNRRSGLPTNFVWLRPKKSTALPRALREYIALGESLGLHRRYKCRVRTPWYTVPSVYAAPVGMLKRCHHFPRLILNRMRALTTDTAYRVRPKRVNSSAFVFSFVNSLTALCAELEGRHYGGGVLELVPSEIERLLIPLVSPARVDLTTLDAAFRDGLAPEALLERQDRIVLRSVGLPRASREMFLSAWQRLRSRRQRSQPEIQATDE